MNRCRNELIKKIKIFISHIPGYRSKTKVNMVFASMYYGFFVIIMLLGFIYTKNLIKLGLSGLVTPVIIFYGLDSMNNQ